MNIWYGFQNYFHIYIMERERFVVFIELWTHWLLLAWALPGPCLGPDWRSTTLSYWDDASTNWGTQLGPNFLIFCFNNISSSMYNPQVMAATIFTTVTPQSNSLALTLHMNCSSKRFYRIFLLACIALSWKYMV